MAPRFPHAGLQALHHVQLAVPSGSEDTCRAFRVGLLGLTEVDKPPALQTEGGCWFRGAGLELHLRGGGTVRPGPQGASRAAGARAEHTRG